MKHPLVNRTSPKGARFLGTCASCGKTNITMAMCVSDVCDNPNMTNEEAIVEAMKDPRAGKH